MLYILVFLIPFSVAMWYLVDQNNRLKKIYLNIYIDVWVISATHGIEPTLKNPKELDTIITNESIKTMEGDLASVEEFLGIKKQSVISNKYTKRIVKLNVLQKRVEEVKTVEGKVEENEEQKTDPLRVKN
ncbi:MAG: hypothetical protein ACJAWV_002714 [Flammeovirgaceae bacterium]|jgi:hypothetical protein